MLTESKRNWRVWCFKSSGRLEAIGTMYELGEDFVSKIREKNIEYLEARLKVKSELYRTNSSIGAIHWYCDPHLYPQPLGPGGPGISKSIMTHTRRLKSLWEGSL